MSTIDIVGAKINNLKNISVSIPLGKITVITGVSGSGKSSLAFDTIAAEGYSRFIESMSTYVRQFLPRLKRPPVDRITNLPPAIAIMQKLPGRNPRSTVATATHLLEFIKVLYAKAGKIYDPQTGSEVKKINLKEECEKLLDKIKEGEVIVAVKSNEIKVEREKIFGKRSKFHFIESGEIKTTSTLSSKNHPIIIDIIPGNDENAFSYLLQAVETGLQATGGNVLIYSRNPHGIEFIREINSKISINGIDYDLFKEPNFYSYVSSIGVCNRCNGLGFEYEIDESKLIDPEGTIGPTQAKSCIKLFKNSHYIITEAYRVLIKEGKIRTSVPYKELTNEEREYLWLGSKNGFPGLINIVKQIEEEELKEQKYPFIRMYQRKIKCKKCNGGRLREETNFVKLIANGIIYSAGEFLSLTVAQALKFINKWYQNIPKNEKEIYNSLYQEIQRRLEVLDTMGLGYLTLNRNINSLSTGEFQRVMLSSIIGAPLSGALYVLDEPTVGLHPTNTQNLINTLKKLTEKKCTLIIVEHDFDMIKNADYIIELGEKGGMSGGKVLFSGITQEFLEKRNLITPSSLKRTIIPPTRNFKPIQKVTLKGVKTNNLKNIDVDIPIKALTVVCGVSGSGKSSLIIDTLVPAVKKSLGKLSAFPTEIHPVYEKLEYTNAKIGDIKVFEPSDSGISSRVIPATYLNFYDHIKKIFSNSPEAIVRNLPSHYFSINTPGGRCEECEGMGLKKIEMLFLADLEVICPSCNGMRFSKEILEISINGKNIKNILDMSMEEALTFFKPLINEKRYSIPAENIVKTLEMVCQMGLGYLTIGQPLTKMSSGEIQRLKIMRQLLDLLINKKNEEMDFFENCPQIIIMDEPTTGLHYNDVFNLLEIIDKFVERGDAVVVIEHHPLVILNANYVIELGPEGGDKGGYVIFSGHPSQLLKKNINTPTAAYLKNFVKEIEKIKKSLTKN